MRSVLAQGEPLLECLIVDDASTDGTPEVLEQLARGEPRIRLFRHPSRRGLSAARNTGLREARGPLVAFLDDDDVWLPGKLARQRALAHESPPEVGLISCGFELRAGECTVGERRPDLQGRIFEHTLIRQPLGNGSTMLVRTEVARALGGFDVDLPRGIDGDFVRRLALTYEVRCVPEILVHVHVAHGHTRITADDRTGASNALVGEQAKLRKFARELERYPAQKAVILGTIGFHHSQLGEWPQAALWFARAFALRPWSAGVWRALLRSAKHHGRRWQAGMRLAMVPTAGSREGR